MSELLLSVSIRLKQTLFITRVAQADSIPEADLIQFSQYGKDEVFKSCALTAIGILGPQDQFNFLKTRYEKGGANDKYLALKSIGDIGTPEAIAFITAQKNTNLYSTQFGLQNCVDLYAE